MAVHSARSKCFRQRRTLLTDPVCSEHPGSEDSSIVVRPVCDAELVCFPPPWQPCQQLGIDGAAQNAHKMGGSNDTRIPPVALKASLVLIKCPRTPGVRWDNGENTRAATAEEQREKKVIMACGNPGLLLSTDSSSIKRFFFPAQS